MKRGLLALVVLALAAPLAASAGGHDNSRAWRDSYLAPSLQRAATQTPNASVPVIVQSLDGSGRAQSALSKFGTASSKLGIVDAAAGDVVAGDLPQLAATNPGLVITPDQPVVLDAKPDSKPKNPKNPHTPAAFTSGADWPAAVGADQLWPALANLQNTHSKGPDSAPSIAFVDSGIDSSRSDFGGRVLAQLDMTSLENNSPGDGNGHGTLVAGLAAGSAPGHAGADPTAGIVSLDVMDDQGMARTSDVIAAAQWILRNHRAYNIRVANFSLHSASPTSFRWDPLDKAVEKLWFEGVVVVAAAGNQGQGGKSTPMAYAPANDPFVITVGALDLHNSTNPDRADAAPWSAWGYTLDGFAKPELSAPGRAITGPVPAGSTLAAEKPAQVIRTPGGTYMTLSGTSLSTPIVSGIAAALLDPEPNALARPGEGRAHAQGAGAAQGDKPRGRASARRTRPALRRCSHPQPEPGPRRLPRARPGGRRGRLRRRLLARRGQGVAQLGRGLLARRLLVGRGLVAGLLVGCLVERRLLERRLVVGCLVGRRLLVGRLLG